MKRDLFNNAQKLHRVSDCHSTLLITRLTLLLGREKTESAGSSQSTTQAGSAPYNQQVPPHAYKQLHIRLGKCSACTGLGSTHISCPTLAFSWGREGRGMVSKATCNDFSTNHPAQSYIVLRNETIVCLSIRPSIRLAIHPSILHTLVGGGLKI